MIPSLHKLWVVIGAKQQHQTIFLILLTLVASAVEASILLVITPFIDLLLNGGLTDNDTFYSQLILNFGLDFTIIGLIFILLIVTSSILRIFLLNKSLTLSFEIGSELAQSIFKSSLLRRYEEILLDNSSNVINTSFNKVGIVIGNIISAVFLFITSGFILIAIVVVLSSKAFVLTASIFFFFFVLYIIILRVNKKKIKINSMKIASKSNKLTMIVNESISGARQIILDSKKKFFFEEFKKIERSIRIAQGSNQFLSGYTKYMIEAIGLSLIIGAAITFINTGDYKNNTLPFLGTMLLGLQRLLPLLQQTYRSFVSVKGSIHSFQDVLERVQDVNFPEYSKDKIVFNKSLSLNNISYKYPNTIVEVLSKTSLTLRKGDKIGLIGGSGSGKTTLSNLIMGVISPSSGSLSVDNININPSNVNQWYNNISSVQQDVFIADNTIINNIAFGVNKDDIDTERVNDCIYKSGLKALIDRMELGVYSVVGESGRLLSGGERQRIGIARALYKNGSLLVLDEITSSLDSQTEFEILQTLKNLSNDYTIIFITHKESLLGFCNRVFTVSEQSVIEVSGI